MIVDVCRQRGMGTEDWIGNGQYLLGEHEASRSDLGGARDCWYWGLNEWGGRYGSLLRQEGLVMQFK